MDVTGLRFNRRGLARIAASPVVHADLATRAARVQGAFATAAQDVDSEVKDDTVTARRARRVAVVAYPYGRARSAEAAQALLRALEAGRG